MRFTMKRLLAALMCAVLLFCLPISSVLGSEAADAFRDNNFTVSIYNDVTGEYVLETRAFTASGITVFRTVNLLKARGMIADFTQSEAELLELRYYLEQPVQESSAETSLQEDSQEGEASGPEPESALLRANDVDRFYVKRNGVLVTGDALNEYMHEGDIIEWIYGEPPEPPAETVSKPTEMETIKTPAEQWNSQTEKAFDQACVWLQRNPDAQSLYLTAMGVGGETADLKVISDLLAQMKRSDTDVTAEKLAKLVLNLSYCGYDRNDAGMADLISRLTEYPLSETDGLAAWAYTMVAFDSRNYTIPNAAANNRQALLGGLLSFQQKDGGFSAQPGGASDPDSTALSLIALSSYQDQAAVAIEKGVDFLSAVQMDSGNYKRNGSINSRSVSLVIAALCSIGIEPDDSRFIKGENTLLDTLLEYACADGSFALTPGGVGSASATEAAIIALGAVKRGANPFHVPAALKSVPAVSPPAAIPQELDDSGQLRLYLVIGSVCSGAFLVLLVLLIHVLRKGRRTNREDGGSEASKESDASQK